MRISYFNYLWDIDGISAGSAIKGKEIIRALNDLGHQAKIHWRSPQPDDHEDNPLLKRNGLKKGLSKYLHGPKCLAQNFKHIKEELEIVEQDKTEILFSRLEIFSCSAAKVAQKKNIPFVLEVDCPTVWEYKHFAGQNHVHIPFIPEYIEKYNIERADAIIVISNILKDYLVDVGGKQEKMYVIPNGADPEKFSPDKIDSEIKACYNTDGQLIIGWIGALHGWSGLENLIEVSKDVLIKRPEVYFMFVGGGQNQLMIEQAFSDHPNRSHVLLPGKVPHDKVPYYLSMMDVVFAPYPKRDFWYPSSMKIFEYMSSGKTVFATDVGQVGEIIQNGENGLLFDPEQSDVLLKELLHVIDDDEFRKKLGHAARERVIEKYSWDQHAKKIEKIFEDVLKNRMD